MTEQEFRTLNPTDYGTGNANLFVSSSVSGSESVPIPPFTIIGMTIPFISKNNVDVFDVIKNIKNLKFEFTDGTVKIPIQTIQKRQGYYYIVTTPTEINEIPVINEFNLNTERDSQFIFFPYTPQSFINSDFNPLLNTTNLSSKQNVVRRVVDRSSNQAIPSNLDAILSGSAALAQLQNCSYTKAGIINSKYNGSVETSRGIPGNEPAVGLVSFKASIHPTDSDVTTIKEIQLSDREIIEVYFNAKVTGTHPNKFIQSFPVSGSFLYIDDETRIVKLANQKIYSVDKNEVYTSNQFGGVTLVS